MREILNEVFSKIEWTEALKKITDKGLEKLAVSAMSATLFDLSEMFVLFIVLEMVDIFSACIRQSAILWQRMYDKQIIEKRGNLLNYIRWIWQAHHWRFIDSSALRDGFFSKTITYFLIIFVGFIGDEILHIKGIPQFVLAIFIAVLVCTETLSILENLDSAGIKLAKDLRSLIQKRKEGIK